MNVAIVSDIYNVCRQKRKFSMLDTHCYVLVVVLTSSYQNAKPPRQPCHKRPIQTQTRQRFPKSSNLHIWSSGQTRGKYQFQ